MDATLFQQIINSEESQLLDFKKEHYNLIGGTDIDAAKFVKDIISFANTIRTETAYIIIGIKEKGGKKEFHGISNPIDDNILQSKIKDKVAPRPHFVYSNIEFKDKIYGVIEIPVRRYAEPIMSTINMKGIEVGKVYCRHGTTNSEAKFREAIDINKWITTISEQEVEEEISRLLAKISSAKEPLSVAISEGLNIAKKMEDEELLNFCKREIKGYFDKDANNEALKHRMGKAYFSNYKIDSYTPPVGSGVNALWDDMKSKEGFYEQEIAFTEGILEIENYLEYYKTHGLASFFTQKSDLSEYTGDDKHKGAPIYIYTGHTVHSYLYKSIKSRFIELLMKTV